MCILSSFRRLYKGARQVFLAAKSLIKSSYRLCATSALMLMTARPLKRSCPTVDRRYVLISFSLEKLRSAEATVTGRGNYESNPEIWIHLLQVIVMQKGQHLHGSCLWWQLREVDYLLHHLQSINISFTFICEFSPHRYSVCAGPAGIYHVLSEN